MTPHALPTAPRARGHLRLLDDEAATAEARVRAVVAEGDAGMRRLLATVLDLDALEVPPRGGRDAHERRDGFALARSS